MSGDPPHPPLTRPAPRRRGYVLLVTLVLLTIAAMAMVGVSRRSMARAVDAVTAERALQSRWAILSCEQTLLPRAELVLQDAWRRTGRPQPAVAAQIVLGDGPSRQAVGLLFADEQAKVNLNQTWRRDPQSVPGVITRLSPRADLRVQLRPADAEDGDDVKSIEVFQSFGQVLISPDPRRLIPATDELTCWGDGRLNFQRASADALLQACAPILGRGQVDRLLSLRQAQPGIALSTAFDEMRLPQRDRNRLTPLLTQSSSCHSLWITADAGGGGGAGHSRFAVREQHPRQGLRTIRFVW